MTPSGDARAAGALLRAEASGDDEVVRMLEDGPFVVAHGRAGSQVFFAVLRLEAGAVVERWRFEEAVAAPNASGHTQLDGPTAPDLRQDTDAAKELVRLYYETVHVGGDHARIDEFVAGDRQIRHEPGVRDGVAAFKADLATLTRSRTIDAIELLIGQGDLVFVLARGTHEGTPCAYLDLYRVEDGRLVEHWGFPAPLD